MRGVLIAIGSVASLVVAPAFAQQPATLGSALARETPVTAALGGPAPPQLSAPAAATALSQTTITLNWQPAAPSAPAQPAATRYEICFAEPGLPCVNGRQAFVLRDIDELARAGTAEYDLGVGPGLVVDGGAASRPIRTPITRTSLTLGIPRRFEGRAFTWSVAACGPGPSRPTLPGAKTPEVCNFAAPRALRWQIAPPVLAAPNVAPQLGYSRLRPALAVRAAVRWADYYLFCISRPGLACGSAPVSSADQLILRSNELTAAAAQPLLQFQGRAMRWTAAACNVQFGCSYQSLDQALDFPVVGPVPAAPTLVAPTNNVWVDATTRRASLSWNLVPDATHYAVCAAPPGVPCESGASVVYRGLNAAAGQFVVPQSVGPTAAWTAGACNAADQCRYQTQARALRFRTAVTDEFRLLTYNVYLRPLTMFRNGQLERAELLPAQLGGYDAIVFNEAFDDDARAELLSKLTQYPYRTRILGADRGVEQDGGVLIVSRWPIPREDQHVFRDCAGSDCAAQKGVSYARVCKNGKPYNVFGTHLQANHDAEHQQVQRGQLRAIRAFIDRQALHPQEAVLIGGDLNLRRDIAGRRSEEFAWIREHLVAAYPSIVTDLSPPCTYCYGINALAGDAAEGQATLDYIVTSLTHLAPVEASLRARKMESGEPWKEFFWESETRELSDHFPVEGRFTFTWPDDQGC